MDIDWTPDGLVEAVTALDLLLHHGVLSTARLEQAADLLFSRGSGLARRAVRLADARAQSPQESRYGSGSSCAASSVSSRSTSSRGGRFVARVDLGDPEATLAVEYDGRWHAETGQLGRDRRRLNALAAAGWRVLHAPAVDLHRLDAFAAAVTAPRRD